MVFIIQKNIIPAVIPVTDGSSEKTVLRETSAALSEAEPKVEYIIKNWWPISMMILLSVGPKEDMGLRVIQKSVSRSYVLSTTCGEAT